MNDPDPDPGRRGRGLLGIVLGLLVLGGAGLLWSSGMVWSVLEVQRDEPLPALAYSTNGSRAVPMVVAGGFIMLAAVVAVLATKTLGRRIIALIVLATSAVTAFAIVQWSAQSADEREASMLVDGLRYSLDQAPQASAFAMPLAIGGVLLGIVAAALLLVSKIPAMMGSKYERSSGKEKPATRPAADDDPQARDRDLWSSLDRGEDPTR